MKKWFARVRDGSARTGVPGCPHCHQRLTKCATCAGNYDTGRLCQTCNFGLTCPNCGRHWTWT
jgi:hypothetical protein